MRSIKLNVICLLNELFNIINKENERNIRYYNKLLIKTILIIYIIINSSFQFSYFYDIINICKTIEGITL